ncbi:ankyrin repeat-containing domain protein [Corynascus novoguineensis]|uniref:Ankyrin repeat-containing domain protein n=1 Tax=Corynascus novoguineensis TaxID=1126955 RepID=A0AAN7HMW3_9PEZI|nr:ankyrin repeat-containing domain protein [Corynascus novoguineensis]
MARWDAVGAGIKGLREAVENAQWDTKRTALLDWLCEIDSRADIERLLLENDASTKPPEWGKFGTVLNASCYCQRLHVAELLLDNGADANTQGGCYGTALQFRMRTPNWDQHVNAQQGFYRNALQASCYFGRLGVAYILLESGADVNPLGGYYGTALQAACGSTEASEDRKELVKLLLERGADMNAQGGIYGNALQASCYSGNVRMVEWLLERVADERARVSCLSAVLMSIREEVSMEVLGTLLRLERDGGGRARGGGGEFGTALQSACSAGGSNVNLRGGNYGSALNTAVIKGYWYIVEHLLEAGAARDCRLQPEPDEEWLTHIREDDGPWAVERYRMFWKKQKEKMERIDS